VAQTRRKILLNFAVVGSGWITDEYIKGAVDTGLWRLSAVYSRTEERGREYAEKHAAADVFTNLHEMARSDTFDAVYIASPNVLHYEQSRLFLEHKKHVVCEKPLSAQGEKAAELFRLAEENGVVFMEAIMYLHLPQRKILKDALKQIGALSMVKIDFCQRSSKLDAYLKGELPNIFNPAMEAGALMDLGVYCIYPVLHLFGLPQSFTVAASILPTGVDSAGAITMRYPDKLVNLVYSKTGQAIAGTEFQGNGGTVYVDSISRLADISLCLTGGKTEALYGDDEKYILMGHEARNFHRFITEPEQSRAEYARCRELAVSVSHFMEDVRMKAGIRFASDDRTAAAHNLGF